MYDFNSSCAAALTDRAYPFECAGCGTRSSRLTEWCLNCARSGLICARTWRPVDKILPPTPGLNAKSLAAMDQKIFRVGNYPDLFLGPGACVLGHGPPGAMKSTWALRVCESLRPALYFPLEEGISPVLAGRLRRLEIRSEDIVFEMPRTLAGVFAAVEAHSPFCIVLDSIQCSTLSPEDVLSLARSRQGVVLAICQERKDGGLKGNNSWPHLADCVVKIDEGKWSVEKSRYQACNAGGSVL